MAYSRPEPLRGNHALEDFNCGEESLDIWLTNYSRHAEAAGSGRVFVTTDDGERVVGYFALTVGEVRPEVATVRLLRGQPKGHTVPVLVLARFAIDHRHQGRGLGRSLLQDALLRCTIAAESVGARAVVVHAATEEARQFYAGFGFEPSPTDEFHLILLMKDLRKLLDD